MNCQQSHSPRQAPTWQDNKRGDIAGLAHTLTYQTSIAFACPLLVDQIPGLSEMEVLAKLEGKQI
jgi:hypothetical protein